MHAVDVLRIVKVRPAHRLRQRVRPLWRADNVNVVCHQAIAMNCKAIGLALLIENGQVHPAVVVNKENVLTVIATLRDMVGDTRKNYSGGSWHGGRLRQSMRRVNK